MKILRDPDAATSGGGGQAATGDQTTTQQQASTQQTDQTGAGAQQQAQQQQAATIDNETLIKREYKRQLVGYMEEHKLPLVRDANGVVNLKKTFETVAKTVSEYEGKVNQLQTQQLTPEQRAQLDTFKTANVELQRQLEEAKKIAESAAKDKDSFILKSRILSAFSGKAHKEAMDPAVEHFLRAVEVIPNETGGEYYKWRDGDVILNEKTNAASLEEAVTSFLNKHDFYLPANTRAARPSGDQGSSNVLLQEQLRQASTPQERFDIAARMTEQLMKPN